MAMRQSHMRLACMATLALLLAAASGENVSPQELPGDQDLGEGMKGPSLVPVAAVSAFAKRIEAENAKLNSENSALRAQGAVDEAKTAVAVAGGLQDKEPKQPTPAEAEALATPPKSQMSPEMKKGAKVMDEYAAKNKKLEDELAKEKAKADGLEQTAQMEKLKHEEQILKAKEGATDEVVHYTRIPFFKFDAGSKIAENMEDQIACESVCNRQPKCKSYSWGASSKTCMWSVDSVHYDQAYTFMVKAQVATAGDPHANWREFPGVKFISAESSEKTNVEFDECKMHCESDVTCKGFSYRQDTKYCAWGSKGLSYAKDFSYYEKGASAPDKAQADKAEKLKKAEVDLQNSIQGHQEANEKSQEKEDKENEVKKQERARWLKGQPTKNQESHLKMTVSLEMKGMDAKFAMETAKKQQDAMKMAEDEMEKKKLDAVAKMSSMEGELAKLKTEKKAEFDKLKPLEEAKVQAEVAVAKLKAQVKILNVDKKLKESAVASASSARDAATVSQNPSAIATTTEQYNAARSALTENEDERGKMIKEIEAAMEKAKTDQKSYDDALSKEKEYKAEYKASQTKNKDLIAMEKKLLKQQEMQLTADKERASTSEVVAMKAKEKMAKSKRAQAKVELEKGEEKMKHVTTEEQRQDLEKEMAKQRGEMFKADQANDEVSHPLVAEAKKLAGYKEKLHKVKATVKKAKDEEDRQNVDNKLQKLENGETKAPF